ncbi:MAG: cysteine--tRNA ligase, partial [Clostridiales bacterium]|nr:cysteine--tRNA ligase [Clostridiales bacterium]
NFFTVRDIVKEYNPEDVRMFMLSAHYRSPVNFSRDMVAQAHASLQRLYTARDHMLFLAKNAADKPLIDAENALLEKAAAHAKRFDDAMDDDLNTADALGAIFELVKDANVSLSDQSSKQAIEKILSVLNELTDVLGLLSKKADDGLPLEIQEMVDARAQARKEKNWKRSDELRDALAAAGYIVKDTPQGQNITKA